MRGTRRSGGWGWLAVFSVSIYVGVHMGAVTWQLIKLCTHELCISAHVSFTAMKTRQKACTEMEKLKTHKEAGEATCTGKSRGSNL